MAILSEAQIFGAEGVIGNCPREYKAKVASASAEFLVLSKEAYQYNAHNLKLEAILTRDVSLTQSWRRSFFNTLIKNSVLPHEKRNRDPQQKISFEEKIRTNYFEKAKEHKRNPSEPQLLETTTEAQKTKGEDVRNDVIKKSQRNLLRIIKSSEYIKRVFSERDQLAMIQVQMGQKMQVFGKKNPDKSMVDLSVEDQKARLEELLKKKLMIYNNKDKKSPKKHSLFRKIKIFLEKDPNQTETMFLRNVNFRVKKSQSFGSTALKEFPREASLPSFIVKNSLNH